MISEAKRKQGKKNRASGARFELKVRKDLESKDWIVDRWSNNVDGNLKFPDLCEHCGLKCIASDCDCLCHSKPKLIPAKTNRWGMRNMGFPDFVAFKQYKKDISRTPIFKLVAEVIGIECKTNGRLDKEEKEKYKWLLDNNVFSKILIASKAKKRGAIAYKELKQGVGMGKQKYKKANHNPLKQATGLLEKGDEITKGYSR